MTRQLSLEDSKSLIDTLNKGVNASFDEDGIYAETIQLPDLGNMNLKMQLHFPNMVKIVSAEMTNGQSIDIGMLKDYPLFYAKVGNEVRISRRLILSNDIYSNDFGERSYFQEKVAGIIIMEGAIPSLRTESYLVDSSEYARAYMLLHKLYEISVPEIKSKEGFRATFCIENACFSIPEDTEKFIIYNEWLPIVKPQDLYRQLRDEYQITRFDGIQKL